jgi:segregation and condensation protein B|tara:strand:+ start:538 stop:1620 length:1083 start_codon:yes stop_codon:yes gene_type:complete
MEDLKKRVEALLFSSGKRMNVEDIAGLCKEKIEDVKKTLFELKIEYERNDSSLMLLEEGDFWKLTVRDQFLPIVEKIVTETELSKTVLETLAVIAFKYPIMQSDLIKIRTNKAYDHLTELEQAGYISRQKHGRSKLIKLTDKFFEYFDLPRDKLRDKFKDFGSIADAIKDKELEIDKIREDQRKDAEDAKKEDERIKQAAESADKEEIPLDTYDSSKSKEEEKPEVEIEKEKLGSLEVVNEPSEEKLEEERERIKEITEPEEQKEEIKKSEINDSQRKNESTGIHLTKEMEKEVDKKVEKIINPKKENILEKENNNGEENQSEGKNDSKENKEKEESEEPKDLLEAAREEEEKKQDNQSK